VAGLQTGSFFLCGEESNHCRIGLQLATAERSERMLENYPTLSQDEGEFIKERNEGP
jgi:hypothetical protein